jgi:hypothetical protein
MSEESPFDEKLPFDADAIAAALAHAAMAQGDAKTVTALAVSTPRLEVTGYRDYNGNMRSWRENFDTTLVTLYLEVPAESFGQLYRVREDVQKNIFTMLQPIIDSYPYYRALVD